MIADDGGAAHGEPQKGSHKHEIHVHHHRVGRHARLSQKVHQPDVVEDAHHGGGDVAHQLRGAVDTGVKQFPAVKVRPHQPQALSSGKQEVHHRDDTAHAVAQHCGPCGTGDTHAQQGDEHVVKGDVGGSGSQGEQ
ncbi:Uncharacterised protein [uncultured Blautia sp.]|nr:Uncharacterised protein [uncultured Blautia sp.]